LRRLPTDGTHAGPGRSNIWLTHMHGAVVYRKLRFGPFELSIGERVLQRDGQVLPLGGRALDILIYLADRPGEVIAKQELIDRVWSDVTVEEGSLRVHVAAIRKALGDGQFGNRYIANIKGRGYSFVGTVVPLAGNTENKEFGGAVYFANLESVTDSRHVAGAVATSLALALKSEDPGLEPVDPVRSRKLLIILDSREHVIKSVALPAELHQEAEQRITVTVHSIISVD
jgi:DNA-binding winged helix-turn-helix (wHTH) protein